MRTLLPSLLLSLLPALALPALAGADEIDDAKALLQTERHEEGVRRMRQAIAALEKKPDDAEAVRRAGVGWFFLEEDDKALTAFRRAVELAPKDPQGHYWLGVLLQYTDLEAAETSMARAVALAPDAVPFLFQLAETQRHQKKRKEALATYRKVLAQQERHAAAHLHVGTLLQGQGESQAALNHYERAVVLDESLEDARYNAGLLHYLAGRFEKALYHWREGARRSPSDFQVHAKCIQALYALERYDEAKAVRETLLKIRAGMEEKPDKFCFDQFGFDGKRVMAFERFDTSGDLVYLYVFYVLDGNGKIERKVNLETSKAAQELGAGWTLGVSENDGLHKQVGAWMDAIPAYPELKRQVIRAAQGKLPTRASSKPGG